MSKKVNFILGVHSHIPNGAAEEEFEAVYNNKIRPLVSALYQFPQISMVFHYSGVLLHWIERHHPELFVLLEDLIGRRQVEFLGGGFYEPIMPFLPQADKIGQIEMLTTYLRRQFGKRPQGCWIPIHAWEQNLVGPLDACGMGYTFLDESIFQAAGGKPSHGNWYEPCITEDQGKIITVFPVFSSFREKNLIALLREFLSSNEKDNFIGPVTVFTDFSASFQGFFQDRPSHEGLVSLGEKKETEYLQIFAELSGLDPQIEFTTPGRIYRNFKGLKKLYFTGSPLSSATGLSGNNTFPRQFIIDYPEAGLIYAKMIHTRILINQLRGDKARKMSALEELWKAQDSSLFCQHGITNALVRKAAYRALLEAEKISRKKGSFSPSLSAFDYDLDGESEYVFKDEKLNCYIKTQGAYIFELDFLPKPWNFLDTFIPETKLRPCVFSDYLVPGESLPDMHWQGINGARFCAEESFQVNEFDRLRMELSLGLPSIEGIPLGNIEVKKTWRLKRNILTLQYELKNTGPQTEHFFLVPMLDLSFSGGNEAFVRMLALGGTSKEKINPGEGKDIFLKELGGIEFRDLKNEVALSLESTRRFDARIFIVERDNGNAILEYLFTCIMPVLQIHLEPDKSWETEFSLKISS